MLCPNCGNEVLDNATVCMNCGVAIKKSTDTPKILSIVSLVLAGVSLIIMILGAFCCMSWLGYITAIAGIVVGAIGAYKSENKMMGIIGVVLNVLLLIIPIIIVVILAIIGAMSESYYYYY